jgi:hypothetical protein
VNRSLALCLLLVGTAGAACAHRPTSSPLPATEPSPAKAPPPGGPEVAAHPAPAPDLGPIRVGADAVLAAQAEALWRVFTDGEAVDPAAAWNGHEALLSDETLRQLGAAVAASQGEERRAASYLRAWLLGERLGREGVEAARKAAQARATATFAWNGRDVPLHELSGLLAREHDRERRRAMADAAAVGARPALALAAARDEQLRAAAGALGYASPLTLAGEVRGEAPAALAALAEAVLSRTEQTWRTLLEELAGKEGMGREDVRARDLPRLLRGALPPQTFPAGRQLDAGATLLGAMGIDVAAQKNLRLDPGARPGKLPHAIALPVQPPGDVRLSTAPIAGLDALRGILHELAVAQHYANVRSDRLEFRRLGPAALPETWGVLFEEVAGNAAWLAEQGVEPEQARVEARAAAARRLLRAREAAARLLAGIARAESPGTTAERAAALAARARGCPPDADDPPDWRLDADPLLRSAEALRAELLAAQVELFLVGKAGGAAWWRAPASGAWLTAAWAEGSRRSPEELSLALGQPGLDPAALDAVVRARAGL